MRGRGGLSEWRREEKGRRGWEEDQEKKERRGDVHAKQGRILPFHLYHRRRRQRNKVEKETNFDVSLCLSRRAAPSQLPSSP